LTGPVLRFPPLREPLWLLSRLNPWLYSRHSQSRSNIKFKRMFSFLRFF
jgi:hypothetical protein